MKQIQRGLASGYDWKCFITPVKNTVQFTFKSSDTLTGKENLTLKLVFNDFLFSEINKSEREYAGEFLEENLNGFKAHEKI